VGNALDGSSGPWRKEAGGATAAGPAATPPAKPRAQFTALLQSLVETGNAPAVRKAAPAVNKEDAPQVAFWMAAPTATSQASHPAKPADGAAGAEDGAHANDSPTGEPAAAPETSGDAATPVAKATPQAGAPLPVALATPKSPWPEAPEDGAELPRAAAQAMENGAPDSKLAAGAAVAEQETAGGTAAESQWVRNTAQADAEAKFQQTGGARRAVAGTQAGKPAASQRETAGGAAEVSQPVRPVTQAGAEAKSLQTAGARPAVGGTQDRKPAASEQETAGNAAAVSQSAQGVTRAAMEAIPRPAAGKQAAAEQETVRSLAEGLRVSSTARMAPAQLSAAGLPAAGQPAAKPALDTDKPARPRSEAQSAAPGATGRNGASGAGTAGGQPLAAPVVAGQAAALSQPDERTAQSGGDPETAPAANAAPAASELPDNATGSGAARPMVVAFTARLRPVEAAPEAPSGELANEVGEPIERAPVSDTAAAAGETAPGGQENSHDASAASPRQPDAAREPLRKPEVSTAVAPEPVVTAHPAPTPPPPAASDAKPPESAPASPPPAATEPAAAPDAPRPAAAHDIKLQVAGQGDQRVEVRVSERAGDMRVDVRTPDSGLAGDLREDLPALASKLEQTGFRAETWHPAGTAERQRTAEAAPGAASQNSERQPGQNGGQRQRDPQPQPKPQAEENDTPSPDAGKDFAWLFSSIQ